MPADRIPAGGGSVSWPTLPPVALALFSLMGTGSLVGFNGSGFVGGRGLNARVQVAKQEGRAYFSGAHLTVSRLHEGFARTSPEYPR
jgi:hypothetical protein